MGSEGFRRRPFFGGTRLLPPVIKWLIIANAAAFILTDFLFAPFTIDGIPLGGSRGMVMYFLSLYPFGTNFFPWQLVTYMFLHGGLFHLLFNMLALWMFGMELEHTWGSRKFLTFYLLCGIGAGITNLMVAPLIGQVVPTIGASGAVFGILTAFGMMFPNRPVYLYFLFPIPAKFFIVGWIVLELLYGVAGTPDGVAHFAHLGGAAIGFLYLLNERGSLPFGKLSDRFGFRNPFRDDNRVRGEHGMNAEVRDARFYDLKTGRRMSGDSGGISQEVIDSILDKIGRAGYQSLTEDEKRILNEASKRMH